MKKIISIFIGLSITLSLSAKRVVTHVRLTSYNPVRSQCNKEPLVTADGTIINLVKLKNKKIKYCAVSRNLLWLFPYGTKILIEGKGIYEVHDTMDVRFSHCIDILQYPTEKNFKLDKVKVVKL